VVVTHSSPKQSTSVQKWLETYLLTTCLEDDLGLEKQPAKADHKNLGDFDSEI